MPNNINSVVLVGNLTKDAIIRYTRSGTAVVNFTLAVNKLKKEAEGNYTSKASFIDIVLWGKQGESLQRYLVKGKQVAVLGELSQNRWEQDGESFSKLEVIAHSIELLGGGKQASSSQSRDTLVQESQNEAPEPELFGGYEQGESSHYWN